MSLANQSQQWYPTSVKVTVLQARNLRIKGKNGTNDAYAVMQVAKDKFSTVVTEKAVNPVWKEEATFDLPLFHHGNAERCTLCVQVMHRVQMGLDKMLGQVIINLLDLEEDKERNKTEWFKLLNKAGKPDKERGEVQLEIVFLRNNMTASMFDLSSQDKQRSRMGKLKDKLRGKKKAGMSDSASAIVPSVTQNLTDSEEEGDAHPDTPSEDKRKSKLKSLFAPKSNLQRNVSQSMSTLGYPSEWDTPSGSSEVPSIQMELPEGKKFAFLTHKRIGSSDNKTTQGGQPNSGAGEQFNICINGSHVYTDQPESKPTHASSALGLSDSMEDMHSGGMRKEKLEHDEEDKNRHGKVRHEEQERKRLEKLKEEEQEKERKEEEERLKKEKIIKEEQERKRMEEQKKLREEKIRQVEEEERIRQEKIRQEEQERKKKEEQEKLRQEKIRLEEEERMRQVKMRQEEQERKKKEEQEKLRQEKIRLEEEERMRQVKMRQEEQERKMKEEQEKLRQEKIKLEEEERMRQVKMRQEEQERKMKEEQEKLRQEKIRLEEEERMRQVKMRQEEQERKREEEKLNQKMRQEEVERMRQEKIRQEEQQRKREEEQKLRQEKIRLEEQERQRKEEEERIRQEKIRLEEQERKNQEEHERMKQKEKVRQEEKRQLEMMREVDKKILSRKEDQGYLEEPKQRVKDIASNPFFEVQGSISFKENSLETLPDDSNTSCTKVSAVKPSTTTPQSDLLANLSGPQCPPEPRTDLPDSSVRYADKKRRAPLPPLTRSHISSLQEFPGTPDQIFHHEGDCSKKTEMTNFHLGKRPAPQPPGCPPLRQNMQQEDNVNYMGISLQKSNICCPTDDILKDGNVKENSADVVQKEAGLSDDPFIIERDQLEIENSKELLLEGKLEEPRQCIGVLLIPKTSSDQLQELLPGKDLLSNDWKEKSEEDLTDERLASCDANARDGSDQCRKLENLASHEQKPSEMAKAMDTTADDCTSILQDVLKKKRRAPQPPSLLHSESTKVEDHEVTSAGTGNLLHKGMQQEKGDFVGGSKLSLAQQTVGTFLSSSSPTSLLFPSPKPAKTDIGKEKHVSWPLSGTSSDRRTPLHTKVLLSMETPQMTENADNDIIPVLMPCRPHLVKPLNASENQSQARPVALKPSVVQDGIPEKTKEMETQGNGPYSQLTQPELISLVVKQQAQIAGKDKKILELEDYIDNLLVRVMEEKPSILMAMSSSKKS